MCLRSLYLLSSDLILSLMKNRRTNYVCQSCGYESARWAGKCPSCGSWNTLVEEIFTPKKKNRASRGRREGAAPISIADVPLASEMRASTHLPELDRVLGGGIVPGSVILVGGDPGIGKSTLMMQMASALRDRVVLYITGEESIQQIKLRAERLEVKPSERVLLLAETNLDILDELLRRTEPDVVVVDSIQTMYHPGFESAPGTVSQVREATAFFSRLAKARNIPMFLVGHVTKEGFLAGPKVVEHMVDTVVQFEGERHHSYRILRAMKNRFGSTNEIGIFEMHDGGLKEVENPSQAFLAERTARTSGSTVVAGMEGSRPLLVEVQALLAPTSYGVPQRTATGFDSRRLQMLLAVLEKRAGLHLGQFDIFVNVAGGIRLDEPAADLGMAVAIVSSLKEKAVDPRAVVIGELGLGGEIRSVHHLDQRIGEASKLGFSRMVVPPRNLRTRHSAGNSEIIEVETIEGALEVLLGFEL
jgi:DNA repair protein RadA/Sms